MKSGFDFSKEILNNAQRLGRESVELYISDLIFSKNSFEEDLIEKYIKMDTVPPPILVIKTGTLYKIVDGHHRVEAHRRKGYKTINVFLAGNL